MNHFLFDIPIKSKQSIQDFEVLSKQLDHVLYCAEIYSATILSAWLGLWYTCTLRDDARSIHAQKQRRDTEVEQCQASPANPLDATGSDSHVHGAIF